MPFTLSHPAAVVPLVRRGLPFSALVVGSMAPDFHYFLFLAISRDFTHSPKGVFLFSLPLGLAILWLFHTWLKAPTLWLLPAAQRGKLQTVAGDFSFAPLSNFVKIAFALVLGAATHLVWDSFTHGSGWLFHRWPLLGCSLDGVPFYRLLQHGSSLGGLLILLLSYWLWWRAAPVAETLPSEETRAELLRRRWLGGLVVLLPLMLGLWAAFLYFATADWYFLLRESAVNGTLWLLSLWLFFCLWWHLKVAKP